MENTYDAKNISWSCRHTWKNASINTTWCLIGCSIGDFGTILFFQFSNIPFPVIGVMILAIINGLITSIILETIILMQQMDKKKAFKTAISMSLISMISMEIAMNLTDFLMTGGQAKITLYTILPMWIAGFLTPLPYNYYRLKKYGKACH
ncbi:MAG TPA: DUF4396 domain-containing protein [Woeseiaceae bacterium]|nr:DUF4396 domain-containing protein [Woeseiaceae bacterium]|tara:strand:+ start:17929 stop:18378 length:450 start_codon:yes stop_codon:yes gene_type:complete